MTGNIPEELIGRIKERVNIVDIVSDYLPLKKAGLNYKGLCPFHSEKTPSFTVNEDKQIFHCFGCGAGGNVITFLMKAGGMAFPDAVSELAKKAGIEIPKPDGRTKDRDSKLDALYSINDAAAAFYSRMLKESGKAKSYLEKRGLTEETVNVYRLGYGGDGWDALSGFLAQKGYSLKLAEELGLIIPKKSGGYYDRFRCRVLFPIIDVNGRVIGFGGRSMDGSEPKYLNSSESIIFKKSESLYGLYSAKKWIRETDEALIVEGYMDLLSLHQAGVRNSVATLGTALTTGHLRLIKRFTANVVTVFDADQAGMKATLRSLDLFLAEGIKGRVLAMPDGHDPDTYVREIGGDEFRDKLKSTQSLMEFFIRSASKGKNTKDVSGKLKIFEEVSPYLARVSNKIEQAYHIKILSEITGTREELLAEELKKSGIGGSARYDVRFKKSASPNETYRAEKNIIRLFLRHSELRDEITKSEVINDFQDERLKILGEKIFSDNVGADPLTYLESEEEKGLYTRLMMEMPEASEPAKELEDCIRSLKVQAVKREKKEVVKSGDEKLLLEMSEKRRLERSEKHKGLNK